MATPVFTAEKAAVTILRPLASSAYGKYTLELPEGIDPDTVHTFDAPDNELGYVARLTNRRVGGLARRFVRADVQVTADDPSDDTWAPDSDVDKVLGDAAGRVASDFFLESDITRPGLGQWREFEDFDIGTKAWVEVFSQRVKLPITRIEPFVSELSVTDVKVHLGGQLVSNEQARLAENSAINRALIQDRKDLVGLGQQLTKTTKAAEAAGAQASAAQESAARADSKAQVADGKAEAAQEVADQTARALALENRQRILEQEAFTSALKLYHERTLPQTGRIGNHAGTLTWRSAKLELPGGLLKNEAILTAENTDDVGYVGVRAVLIARIDAVKHYTDSFELNVTKDNPRDRLWLFAENVVSLTVTIYTQFDFGAILADERRKRGLT